MQREDLESCLQSIGLTDTPSLLEAFGSASEPWRSKLKSLLFASFNQFIRPFSFNQFISFKSLYSAIYRVWLLECMWMRCSEAFFQDIDVRDFFHWLEPTEEETAWKLYRRGFSVRQLIQFVKKPLGSHRGGTVRPSKFFNMSR